MSVKDERPLLSSVDLDEIEKTVQAWKKNPKLIGEWARDAAMKSALTLQKVQEKAKGRTAARDINATVGTLVKLLQGMHESGMLAAPPPQLKDVNERESDMGGADQPEYDGDNTE